RRASCSSARAPPSCRSSSGASSSARSRAATSNARAPDRRKRFHSVRNDFQHEEAHMLWTIALVLLVLWALGLVSSFTMGGFVHVLLVAAVVLVLVRLIQGRRIA